MPDLVSKECIRSFHVKASYNNEDALVMSIRKKYDDGTETRDIEIKYNYQRPFYVTRKAKRNHKQKRSTEAIENVQTFYCTESELSKVVPRKLPFPYNKRDFWSAKDCPYLYGTDQHAEFLSKLEYNKGIPKTTYTYASLDIEYDVLDRLEHKILMNTVSMGKHIKQSINKQFLDHIDNAEELIKKCTQEYLGEFIKDGMIVDTEVVDPLSAIVNPIKQLHAWRPDIVGVWNIAYDIPTIVESLEPFKIDPSDVFSDPEVPPELRKFAFVKGPSEMIDKNGVATRLGFHERWHRVYSTSYFELLDSMCVFSEMRSQEAKRPSYSLDAILDEFLNLKKLKFDYIESSITKTTNITKEDTLYKLLDKLNKIRGKLRVKTEFDYNIKHTIKGLEHHILMQDKYPIEYCVYNIFDSYSMILLENTIKDMTLKMGIFMGDTPLRDLKRRAKRLSDMIHIYATSNNRVAGTAYSKYPDERMMDLSGWIITADAYMIRASGTRCVVSNPDWITSIYCNLLEVDLKSSYPSIFRATRASRSTRVTTIASVDNKDVPIEFRRSMIGLIHGDVNAMDIHHKLYNKPSAPDILFQVGKDLGVL